MLGTMLVGAWLLIQQQCCSVYGDSGNRFRSAALVDPLMRRSPLEKNFMRFGRSSTSTFLRDTRLKENFMRFGRPVLEPQLSSDIVSGEDIYGQNEDAELTTDKLEQGTSRSRRAKENFMRFGRGDVQKDEDQGKNEKSKRQDNFMRFGKKDESVVNFDGLSSEIFDDADFTRPLRSKENFMRFGRDKERVVRNEKGKQDSFIRFGKSEGLDNGLYDDCDELEKRKIRGGDNGFVRFGRGKEKFMRFGKKSDDDYPLSSSDKDKAILIRVARDQDGYIRSARQRQQDSSNGFIRFGRSDRRKRDTHKHKDVDRLNSASKFVNLDPNIGVCKSSILEKKPVVDKEPDCSNNSCKPLYLPWPFSYQPSLYSVLPNVIATPQISLLPHSQIAHKPKRSRTGLQNFIRLG